MDSNWRSEELGLQATVKLFVRNAVLIFACVALVTTAGLLFITLVDERYTGTVTLLVPPDETRLPNSDLLHIELETHRNLLLADVFIVGLLKTLAQEDVEAFRPTPGRMLDHIHRARSYLRKATIAGNYDVPEPKGQSSNRSYPSEESESLLPVANSLRTNLQTSRVGQSRLLRVTLSSPDAERTVRVLNAIAKYYVAVPPIESPNDVNAMAVPSKNSTINNSSPHILPEFDRIRIPGKLEIVTIATISALRVSPDFLVVLAISVATGFTLGVFIAIWRETKRST